MNQLRACSSRETAIVAIFFAYLTLLAVPTHLFETRLAAFALVPLPLLFFRFNSRHVLILYFACTLVFFEAFMPTSNLHFLAVYDSVLIWYMIAYFFLHGNLSSLRLPVSGFLIVLYLFVAYGLVRTIPGLQQFGADVYVLRDMRNLLYLGALPIFLFSRATSPRGLISMFFWIVIFAAIHACVHIVLSSFDPSTRAITWNEVYFGIAAVSALVLLRVLRKPVPRILLVGASIVCTVGLLLTQTRAEWIATLFTLLVYLTIHFRGRGLKAMFSMAFAAVPLVAGVAIAIAAATELNIMAFVQERLTAHSENELSDASSSLGFRIYESYRVLQESSFLGNGSGARIYLYNPMRQQWMYWWSIHSEYVEILHKYGYVGLFLFLTTLIVALWKAARLAVKPGKLRSTLGMLALVGLTNLTIVSITSGYLVRINTTLLVMLLITMVERYDTPRSRRRLLKRASIAEIA